MSQRNFKEDSYGGRKVLELAGTHKYSTQEGTLFSRLGIAVPIGDDTNQGSMVAQATNAHRPADSIGAVASTVAIRGEDASHGCRHGERTIFRE